MNAAWKWMADAYKGYLWPWLIFFPAVGYGWFWQLHSAWRIAMWPCLIVALYACSTVAAKIKKTKADA